jgi:hypothetical protein
MFPDTGTGGDVSSGWIPINISNTVVISGGHELQICCQVLFILGLLALKVHVVEVHIETLLRVNSSNNDESTLG